MSATWEPVDGEKSELDWHVQTDVLRVGGVQLGCVIEMIDERFYPHAYDVLKKEWTRGGCFSDPVVAQRWVEELAGVRPRR